MDTLEFTEEERKAFYGRSYSLNKRKRNGPAAKAECKRRYQLRYPEKHAAHKKLARAVRDGKIVRQACEVCGRPDAQGHHDDYSKPLEVRFLCSRHHTDLHQGILGVHPLLRPVVIYAKQPKTPSQSRGRGLF